MKKILFALPLFLLLFDCTAFGQEIWNQKTPLSPFSSSTPFANAYFDGSRYLITVGKQILEIDQRGTITGFAKQEELGASNNTASNFIRRRYDAVTGEQFFLIGTRKLLNTNEYSLLVYRPGQGFVGGVNLADDWGGISHRGTAIAIINDSSFAVFGKNYARKLTWRHDWSVAVDWEKSLMLPNGRANAAVFHDDNFYVASNAGEVAVLNSDGFQTSIDTFPYTFRGMTAAADGLILCGKTVDEKAALVKLTFDGDLVWSKTFPDKEYYAVDLANDGGIFATGESDSLAIVALKTDLNGNQIWRQSYQKGKGATVSATPDGGCFLTGATSLPSSFYAIKTDALGQVPDIQHDIFIQNRRLKTESIQSTFAPSPSLFFDAADVSSMLISVPDTAATILSFAPWMGGLDDNDVLHLAAADFGSHLSSDYQTGFMNSVARDFRRVWAANKEEINRLRLDFGTDQTLNKMVPFDLLTWPAKGNPHLRYNLDFTPVKTDPALFPAPFVDANGDGLYNVYDGDYPRIKGEQMVWWALTDSTVHKRSGGKVLEVDLSVSAYIHDCPQTGAIDRSLFVDFEIINRSATSYHNTYMGFFADPDLGCFDDDYIGALPDANAYYVYNQDNFDGNCIGGALGFGDEIPVQTVSFVNQSLDRFIYYNNPSVSNPPIGSTDPDLSAEFYKYLKGIWRDDTPLTTGGNGYNPGSTAFESHAFPDNPADPQGWSMCTANLPYADRRTIGSHGPFSFAAGDTFKITVAFTLHPDIPHPCPDIFGVVKPVVEQVNQWKNDGLLDASIDLGQVVKLPSGQSITLNAEMPGATYLWSTGETTPSISVAQPGEFSVTVTAATGCQLVENVLLQLASLVPHPTLSPAWKLQPNPASDAVFVECADCDDGDLQAILRNAQGAAVLDLQGKDRQFRLETKDCPAGFYWLELWQEGRFLGGKKLVLTGR